MKHRTLLLLIPDLLALAIILCFGLAPRSRITMENAARIKVGMTRADVEAILGPPRDESNQATIPWVGRLQEGKDHTSAHLIWKADGLYIEVGFNANGIVWWVNKFAYSVEIETDWQMFFRQVKATVGR